MTVGGRALSAPTFDPRLVVDATTAIDAGSGSSDWVGRAVVKPIAGYGHLCVYYRAEAHHTNVGALHIRFRPLGGSWGAIDTDPDGNALSGWPLNPPANSGSDAGEPWVYQAPSGDYIVHGWRIDYAVEMGGTHQWRLGSDWEPEYEGMVHFGGVTDSSIVFATDDDFVDPDGVTYAGARVYTGGADGTPSQSILIKNATRDLAITAWKKASTICDDDEAIGGNGAQEVGIEYLGNGRILALLRDNDHTHGYMRIAENMGATDGDWGALTDVTADLGIHGRARVYSVAKLLGEENWWDDNRLLIVYFVHQTSGSSMPRRNAIGFGLKVNGGEDVLLDGPHYIDSASDDGGYGDLFWDDGFHAMLNKGTLLAGTLYQYDFTPTFFD